MHQWPKLMFPNQLRECCIQGEVIPLSGEADNKPSLAVLNDREMLVFTHHEHFESGSHFNSRQNRTNRMGEVIHTVMYRTEDGGKTWECCGHMPFHDGYEATATVIDGVIYVQTHEFANLFSDHDRTIARFYCSEDKGYTWYETRIDPAYLGTEEDVQFCPDRNFISLRDGSVAAFIWVIDPRGGHSVRLTTQNHGRTWKQDVVDEGMRYVPADTRAILCESFFFRTPKTQRLMAISRVEWARIPADLRKQIPYAVTQALRAGIDCADGMLLLESEDEGLSWKPVRGLGYLGTMYPSVVYTDEENLILTYTKRTNTTESPYPHMGVQAVLGKELPDGSFTFDFEHDILIIDDRTPDYSENGSGYGITHKLSDGSLITPYSYRINMPVLDEILRAGGVNDEEVFLRYYRPSNRKRDSGLEDEDFTIRYFRQASYDIRRHLVSKFAAEKRETFFISEILKWKLER